MTPEELRKHNNAVLKAAHKTLTDEANFRLAQGQFGEFGVTVRIQGDKLISEGPRVDLQNNKN